MKESTYNKKYDTVKILHYDLNGYVIYQKWFDDGKMLKPKFMEIKNCHHITREEVTLLVSNAVQSSMRANVSLIAIPSQSLKKQRRK